MLIRSPTTTGTLPRATLNVFPKPTVVARVVATPGTPPGLDSQTVAVTATNAIVLIEKVMLLRLPLVVMTKVLRMKLAELLPWPMKSAFPTLASVVKLNNGTLIP